MKMSSMLVLMKDRVEVRITGNMDTPIRRLLRKSKAEVDLIIQELACFGKGICGKLGLTNAVYQ